MEDLMQRMIEAVNELGKPTLLDWAPVVLSFIAVIVAVCVPRKIANKQNQIAIFDKLFNAYSELLSIKSLANVVEDSSFTTNYLEAQSLRNRIFFFFEASFNYKLDTNCIAKSIGEILAILNESRRKSQMIPLLVLKDKIEIDNCKTAISEVYHATFLLLKVLLEGDLKEITVLNESLIGFVQVSDEFFEKYSKTIEDALRINNS